LEIGFIRAIIPSGQVRFRTRPTAFSVKLKGFPSEKQVKNL